MDLADRHVVVTGAARGIGAALARRFAAAGARVVVADIGDTSSVADSLPQAVGVTVDVGSEQGNVDLIARAEEAFGPIDLFFANAGVGGGTDLDTPEESWQQAFDVNINAHRWAAKHLIDGWLARGEGYFCSTASAAGLLVQIGSAPYTVTKRAAVAFAEWLSVTYGDRGVRVSCLCPQGVNTDMLRAGDDPALGGGGTQVVRSAGVVLEPEQVADVVADAIAEERFLILPHPEVHEFVRRKADDPDRWLAGMRKLQRRFLGT
jgi:NAD(P)-dependent dehydrogenase (short-subunit alcohol dehydrogenase family)